MSQLAPDSDNSNAADASQPERVMLDIETLGTEPGCAVVAIGAVRFGAGAVTDDEFCIHVNLESCQRAGLTIDAETLKWWLDQDPAAQDQLRGGVTLRSALTNFDEWFAGADEIWAHAPAFDCNILGAAYDALDLHRPWDYRAERCHRTLVALFGDGDVDHRGTEHDALDDARAQARSASQILADIEDTAEVPA